MNKTIAIRFIEDKYKKIKLKIINTINAVNILQIRRAIMDNIEGC